MVYYIADMHLGHEAVIKMCNRPFGSIEEMNQTIIDNWNKKVGKADVVYVLGDVFWTIEDALNVLPKLKGRKILIYGNHDNCILNNEDARKYFDDIKRIEEVSLDCRQLTLSHYPMVEFKHSRKRGSKRLGYLIYGHIHNRCEGIEYEAMLSLPNALNAGVEINNYEPCTFDELWDNNMAFKKKVLKGRFLEELIKREEEIKKTIE